MFFTAVATAIAILCMLVITCLVGAATVGDDKIQNYCIFSVKLLCVLLYFNILGMMILR